MARNYSKGTYTVNEIAEIVFKKCPGRFKDVSIAHRQVNKMMAKLGIKDINGKRRCMFITATDTARLIDAIVNSRTRKTKKPGEQISLPEILNGKPLAFLDPYTPRNLTEEEPEGPREVDGALHTPRKEERGRAGGTASPQRVHSGAGGSSGGSRQSVEASRRSIYGGLINGR